MIQKNGQSYCPFFLYSEHDERINSNAVTVSYYL